MRGRGLNGRRPKHQRVSKDDRARFQYIREHGCICCKKIGRQSYAEVHHIVEARKRLGNQATIPLCSWHHRGVPIGIYKSDTSKLLGPALSENKREFKEAFGSEKKLLEEFDQWIKDHERALSRV